MAFKVVRHALAVSGVVGVLSLVDPAHPQPTAPATSSSRRCCQLSIRLLRATPLNCGWRRRLRIARPLPAIRRSRIDKRRCGCTPTKNTNRRFVVSPRRQHRSPLCVRTPRITPACPNCAFGASMPREAFSVLKQTPGFVGEAAALGEAEAVHALGEFGAAAKIYADILDGSRRRCAGHLAESGQCGPRGRRFQARSRGVPAFVLRVSTQRARCTGRGPLQTLPEVQPIATGNPRYKLELGRGERLFASRRYPDARTSFLRLKPHATSDDDAELVALRLAEIEYFQARYSNAREALRPFLTTGARQARPVSST